MKYVADHDLHIHSQLSLCSRDPEQTPQRILEYAKANNLKQICLTDHFWDETVKGASDWYKKQDYAHICQALPLPVHEGIDFLFGCEIDFDRNHTVGLSREHFDRFDFVIIPTTHLHMDGFTIEQEDVPSLERRAELWGTRLDSLLDMDLPFEKIGIAHPTCSLTAAKNPGDHIKVFSMIPQKVIDGTMEKAAAKGAGIELNFDIDSYTSEELEIIGRVYRTAKKAGCKFYCGSDAHHPAKFETIISNFNKITEWLDLSENDKFIIGRKF